MIWETQQFGQQHFMSSDAVLTKMNKLIFVRSVRQQPAGCLNQAVNLSDLGFDNNKKQEEKKKSSKPTSAQCFSIVMECEMLQSAVPFLFVPFRALAASLT